jgi:predicted alpha/beta superfamily hydrolase
MRHALSRFAAPVLLAAGLIAGCSRHNPTAPVGPAAAPTAAAPVGAAAANVTFRVTVPPSTPDGDLVHIAGDFQGWNPGSPAHALAKQPDGRWQITLSLGEGAPIQFKFTRGTWAKVEKGPSGEEIANRSLTVPAGGGDFDFTVATWADLGTVVGDVETFTHAPFLAGRTIRVYLPPGYAAGTRRYPVLYLHDGQNLFDVRTSFAGEWKVDEACEQLIAGGEIAPLIVVGIDNAGANRIHEYTPWPDAGYGGGGGDSYLQAIRDVLMPEIDRRYRTLTGPGYTWIGGSSLGGLISTYAGYAYPETWSRVAALSPSYGWDGRHIVGFAQGAGRQNLTRLYHDMGTAESGTAIADLRAVRDVALAQGFVLGVDLGHVEIPGGQHNETAWAARFPDVLRFVVGAPSTLDVP